MQRGPSESCVGCRDVKMKVTILEGNVSLVDRGRIYRKAQAGEKVEASQAAQG